jgi:hypothetical protein
VRLAKATKSSADKSMIVLAVFLGALASLACSSNAAFDDRTIGIVGEWQLETPSPGGLPAFELKILPAGEYRYFDGCNMGGGGYAIVDGQVQLSESGGHSTKACAGRDGVIIDLVGLDAAPSMRVEGGGEVLTADSTIGRVRFARVESLSHLG